MSQRRQKSFVASMVLFLMLTLVLAACGEGAPATTGPVTVNWWTWNPGGDTAKQLVATFNKEHPTIKLVFKNQQYNDYINNLKLSMVSGTGPDIFGVQAGAMPRTYAPFMEDLTPYAQKAWGDNWRDRFYSTGLKSLTFGETTRALPFFISGAGYLWYNKTIFDTYKLQPPTTFDQWVSVSKTLQSKGVTPFVQGAKDAWVNYDMFIALANNIAPGKIYQAEEGQLSWTDPDLVKAMDYWHQLFHNGIMQKGALGISEYPDAYNLFTGGKAAMILLGTWEDGDMTRTAMDSIKKQMNLSADEEFLPTPFPSLTETPATKAVLFGGPDVGMAINKASPHKDAAWTVVQWLSSNEAQTIYAKQLAFPAIKTVSIDSSVVITHDQQASLQQQTSALADVIGPREIPYPELQTALADALQNVADDGQTPQQALAAVQQASQGVNRS